MEREPIAETPPPDARVDAGDLRSVERLIAALDKQPDDPFRMPRRQRTAAAEVPAWNLPPLPNPSNEQRGGFLAWLFLSFGLMAFTCGGIMLVWSVVAGREELWSLGVPLALGGQGGIIFGLMGLAEAASQRQKQASSLLEEYRQRIVLLQNLSLHSQLPQRRAA
jgi:hypothetical protein